MQSSIERFTLSLLAYKGALIESQQGCAGVLLGTDLASILELTEYQRLVFDPARDEPGAVRVGYDDAVFENAGRLIDAFGSVASVCMPAVELKGIDPERELERGLRLRNGVFRLKESTRGEALYLCFLIRYDVMADERSGGVVEVWVNPESRSIATLPALSDAPEADDAPRPAGLADLAGLSWDLARPAAASIISKRLTSFTESLKRRGERDLRRMREYYQAIDQEIRVKIERSASKEENRKSELQRLDATHRAYRARAVELRERYGMRVQVTAMAVLASMIPIYRMRVQLMRRTRKTEALFSWNPFDKRIDRRCCDACRMPVESAQLCDDQVHYLCPECLAPCPACSKMFCRACHRRCPRPHTA